MVTSILKVVLTTLFFIGCSRGQNASLRVFSGHEAEVNEIPYIVSIMFSQMHICGGSIINEEWVITAAHCVANRNDLKVFAGLVELAHPGAHFQVSNVKEVFLHPQYDFRVMSVINDVALLHLEDKFVLNQHVAAIKFIEDNELEEAIEKKESALISGWGSNENSILSASLFSSMVTLLSDAECLRRVDTPGCGFYQSGMHLCSPIDDLTKGAGLMDDGGPVVVRNKLAGIILHGKNVRDRTCSVISSLYASVRYYKTFIESHLPNKTVTASGCPAFSGNEILFELECSIGVERNTDPYNDGSTPVLIYSVKNYNYWFFGTRDDEDRDHEYGFMKESPDSQNYIINLKLVKSSDNPKSGLSLKVFKDFYITPYVTIRRNDLVREYKTI